MTFYAEREGGKVKKQEFVLNELGSLGDDIRALVDDRLKQIDEEKKSAKAWVESHDKGAPMIASSYNPNLLKPELRFFISRLNGVMAYLEESEGPGRIQI
jgi:hypothetical protein